MKEEDCRQCGCYPRQRCSGVADFSIAGLMGSRPRHRPQPPAPAPLPPNLWMTNEALLLSTYFFKLGYYQPAGPLISAGPLHGGFKGAEGAPGPPPPQDPAYSRYQYPQPQQVMHYGSGYSHPQYGGGYAGPGAPMGAPPPPSCYRPPPNYRPPPPPDNQGSPAAGEAYAPQYCAPCYQHPHVPPRPSITYLDSAYQGCPCPMQSCPKNVHTGPVTGNPPPSGGPGKTSARSGGGEFQRRALLAPSLPPEALGPPSPARGSAGLAPPHPPRRARLGKAMARKSISPGDTSSMLLMCRPPQPRVKAEADSGDEVILLDSPADKAAPIDLSSSEDNSPDGKSDKDCVILRTEETDNIVIDLSAETKKENKDVAEISPPRLKIPTAVPEVQALKEHNTDSTAVRNSESLKKPPDAQPKTATKRRCSKLEIDMEVDMDDSLAANGIGEHVKLQKRQKASLADSQTGKKLGNVGSYKDLIKKNDKVFKLNNGKRQLNTIKMEKSKSPAKCISLIDSDKSLSRKIGNKRKSVSPSVRDSPVNKRKRFGHNLLKSADKHPVRSIENVPEIDKPRENIKKSIMASIPKSKSVALLDDLIMKNNIERVIESVVKNVPGEEIKTPETNPAVLFSPPIKSPSKTLCISSTLKPKRNSIDGEEPVTSTHKSRTVLNINNNVVKKVNDTELSSVPIAKAEHKISPDKCRNKSKSPAAINRLGGDKKPKEPTKGKIAEADIKDATCIGKVDGKTKKATKACAKGLGKRRGKSTEGSEISDGGLCVEGFRDMPLLRRGPMGPRWSNGWRWEGESLLSKVYVNNEESCIMARCWTGMRHSLAGDSVRRGDSVLLRAGARRSEPPFVARVSQLWENPTDGEMMVSLLWYYRPEHTERGRQPEDCTDEVFASRHRDANSVACIEDKCYVLTYNEYCRYRKQLRAVEENVRCTPSIVPSMPSSELPPSLAPGELRPPPGTAPELVLFCRRVYDFRLKKVISVTAKGKAYYN